MNYIGSKKKLLSFLENVILEVTGGLGDKSFYDLFSGTTIVAQHFKPLAKEVVANDFEYYSYVLGRNYIQNSIVDTNLIDTLNSVPGEEGFITTAYSHTGRMYFTEENAMKIDAVREYIQGLYENGDIDEDNYYFALCSLLESADKVANTASVYGAFLKKYKNTALTSLTISPALPVATNNQGTMYNKDINDFVKEISGDVVYLDPPYNPRQYGSNYHMLNTIASYKPFEPKGKTGLPEYQKSKYCSKVTARKTFEELISNLDFKYIFISYNNEGIISNIGDILSQYGKYTEYTTDYARFRADKSSNRNVGTNKVIEYLHVLEKD